MDVLQQPSRGRNQDMSALFHVFPLKGERLFADQHLMMGVQKEAQGIQRLCDLLGQLPGRYEDQCLRIEGIKGDVLQDGQRIGQRLAASGLRLCDQALALQQPRDDALLYRGQRFILHACQRFL